MPRCSNRHYLPQTFSRSSKRKECSFNCSTPSLSMAPPWVKSLKPSGPQGSELLKHEREQSNIPVDKLSEFLFTKEVLARQKKILNILTTEKVFDKSQNYFNGREERFKTALARQKRMRQLAVRHQWTKDEYMMASELISEPGPYGLHVSMFLVWIHNLFFNAAWPNHYSRSLSETKALLSSTSCSLRRRRITRSSDAMLRQSWAMDQMSVVWKRLQPGIRTIRLSYYTLPILQRRSGGLVRWAVQQIMPL